MWFNNVYFCECYLYDSLLGLSQGGRLGNKCWLLLFHSIVQGVLMHPGIGFSPNRNSIWEKIIHPKTTVSCEWERSSHENQIPHNNWSCINYSFCYMKLMSYSRDLSTSWVDSSRSRDFLVQRCFSALLEPAGLYLCSKHIALLFSQE